MDKHCEAGVGFAVLSHGFGVRECGQVVGIRRFVDGLGEDRFYCSIKGHKRLVERRFGTYAEAEAMYEARQAELQELQDAEDADNGLPDIPLAAWSEAEKAGAWGR